MKIIFLLDKQVIKRTDSNVVVAGSRNYLYAHFAFASADWTAPVTVLFNETPQLLDENGDCLVPWEVIAEPGSFQVSAFCSTVHTANVVSVPVEKTLYKAGETPPDPSPDVYTQLTQMVQEAIDTAESVRDDADAGKLDGKAATIQVGEVTASDPGSEPQVKNSGTENAAVFDFVLPRGQTGPTGQAATIEVESTVTGEPGTQASVENVGTTGAAKLRFTIPRGNTGQNGTTPTLAAGNVETLEPGQPATASVTGEGPAYQINLGIPRGQTGAQGTPGKNGQDGKTPTIVAGTVTTLDPGQDATAEITGETPNLTLNLGIPKGQPGQDGVQLNENAVTTTEAWSSKKIVDTLCPPFSVSGNPVTCHPVEGYPLSAVVTLEPKQAGTGDPSPDNVRPISGYDSVTVTQSKDEAQVKQITLTLPETIYGGTVDAVIGVGENTYIFKELAISDMDNGEKYPGWKNVPWINEVKHKPAPDGNFATLGIYGVTNIADISQGNFWNSNGTQIFTLPKHWGGKTQSQIKEAYPDLVVQFCLQLATPEPFQAAGNQPLPAVAGLNTVYTDGDSLAVSGRQDLLYTLQTMQAQTQNLNRFIAEGGTK